MSLFENNPVSGFIFWCRAHEEFFAVKLSRLLAVLFIIAGFFFLVKSIGLI